MSIQRFTFPLNLSCNIFDSAQRVQKDSCFKNRQLESLFPRRRWLENSPKIEQTNFEILRIIRLGEINLKRRWRPHWATYTTTTDWPKRRRWELNGGTWSWRCADVKGSCGAIGSSNNLFVIFYVVKTATKHGLGHLLHLLSAHKYENEVEPVAVLLLLWPTRQEIRRRSSWCSILWKGTHPFLSSHGHGMHLSEPLFGHKKIWTDHLLNDLKQQKIAFSEQLSVSGTKAVKTIRR